MRQGTSAALAALFFPVFCFASLTDLAGEYVVLEMNDNQHVSGVLHIVSNQNEVGMKTIPLQMATNNVSGVSILTPPGETQFTQTNERVVQEHASGRGTISVEYQLHPGYLSITSTVCVNDTGCDQNTIVASQGGSPGEEVNTDEFLRARDGQYQIHSAGGAIPKPADDKALVGADLGYLMMPYCKPGGACNPGYIFTQPGPTKVYKRDIETAVIYDVFVGVGAQMKYYNWLDVPEGDSTFRSLHYVVDEQRVCMEHVISKIN